MSASLKGALFEAGTPPQLHGSRCRACGLVAFPAERYGCERCGAPPADHENADVPAEGVVRSFALVHRHHQPDPPAPFVVVQVDLPSGLSLKGVLEDHGEEGSEVAVQVGARVEGVVIPGEQFRWRVTG